LPYCSRCALRFCRVLAFLLLALAASSTATGDARAQPAALAPAGTDAPSAFAEPAPDALAALISTLENPAARAALLERLRTLAAAGQTGEGAGAEAAAPAGAAGEPGPDTVAATVVDELTTELRRRSDGLLDIMDDALRSTEQLPVFYAWLGQQVADPSQRTVWLGVLGILFVIFAAGLIARANVLRWRPVPDPERPRQSGLGRFAVELAAAVVFGGLTLGMLWIANRLTGVYAIDLEAVANAALGLGGLLFLAMLWGATVRLLFGERLTTVRLVQAGDETARLCRNGLLLIGRLGFIGLGVLHALESLGLPNSVFAFLVHLLYLVVAGIAVVLILRLQSIVATAIRDVCEHAEGPFARFVPARFLAGTWHVFAVLLVLLHYLVWALKVPGGLVFLSRATVVTIAILVVARLTVLWIDRLFESGVPLTAESEDLLPGVQERADRYARPAQFLLRAGVMVLAALAILTAWNIGVVDWLRSDTGTATIGLGARLALIVGLTILAFELTSLVANRISNAKDESGKLAYSNRARTLTSILKNVGYVIFGMAGIFTALSHLGVEAAPLLAGAGVVGLAIGFGSQALVKDLITGLFILLGDTIRVGDVVDIGGKAGVVETMSMRTINLRSYDGSVHTIPYGSVDVVTNLTKEFSFAVLDVGIAYRENTDEVIRVLREIDDRMRKEWPYRRLILEPLDIAGVEQLADSAVVIRMRSKTRPGEQWGIKREFLRRIKLRFDELGIEIPFPHQTVYFGVDKEGKAPPLTIQRTAGELPEAVEPMPIEQAASQQRAGSGG